MTLRTLSPLVPAKAGTQKVRDWIPACVGMNGPLTGQQDRKRQ